MSHRWFKNNKMENYNHIDYSYKGITLLFLFVCFLPQAFAGESLSAAIDCSEVDVKFIDNPEWTRSERIEAMNRAFFESVNRFELCNLSSQSSASSESANEASQAASAENESGSGNLESDSGNSEEGFDSVSSPLLTGTETESTLPAAGDIDAYNVPENSQENIDENTLTTFNGAGTNGALPEDIPDANNDDVVASQIRLAAEIEKDPVKKEKLWNEYRKYKGLPTKGMANEQ